MTASVEAAGTGILAQTETAVRTAESLSLTVEFVSPEATPVTAGATVMRVSGAPLAIAQFEEQVIGILAKPSGIATAARAFVEHAEGRIRIVSGAWKKLPLSQKEMIRSAIVAGGASPRIAEWPFVYLDKNLVCMLGGVGAALAATDRPELAAHRKIVQITEPLQACEAAEGGAGIVFVDTGHACDAVSAAEMLRHCGLRRHVDVAFGGGIRLEHIDTLRTLDIDIVDVGRAIVDADLLDMRLRVEEIR
ncbi:hypothetical protein OG563_46795 [Nocardia vinacea]|uniref:Nicotinate-nucleotide pyrophosphorylase n=1 Tax=Nocardia vinacea TaxID=96468 RepID=A0ABZ1YT71_9NOCA|nr:hypothetical protein [Nocardia vinacea]